MKEYIEYKGFKFTNEDVENMKENIKLIESGELDPMLVFPPAFNACLSKAIYEYIISKGDDK